MKPAPSFADTTDRQLLLDLKRLAHAERQATAELIACLAEVDARRLYLGEGCSSLFTYCTQVLRLSEHAAYGRIEAARAVRRFPLVLELLMDGALTLTAVSLLRPHLTDANHADLLTAARHKSKRDVEQLVAAVQPKPDVPPCIRKLPSSGTAAAPATALSFGVSPDEIGAESRASRATAPSGRTARAVISPLGPERYRLQVTLSREGRDRLRRLQDLLRHRIPNGDPAAIIERALQVLLEDTEKQRLAAVNRPRPGVRRESASRYVPAAVRREVWTRDGGQCAFTGTEGRCTERASLELHHVVPYADGGATSAANLQLRCRAHNRYEAEHWEGLLFVDRATRRFDLL
jgi:hypothetical protein